MKRPVTTILLQVLVLLALGTSLTSPPARAQAPGTVGSGDLETERQAPAMLDAPSMQQPAQPMQERAQPIAAPDDELRPFGHGLFRGGFQAEREDGVNPDYLIVAGDRIMVRIWGALEFNETLTVDLQGNIFIPEIGPIRVRGVQNQALNRTVERAVRTVFTQNVNVYTNLEGTQPVVVYVTGFVKRPGSYAGVASDSILYFLDRAGGIDLQAGSFRDIRLTRAGKTFAQVDLYEFLLDGEIEKPQFTDGDTIVVGPRLEVVTADGETRNAFEFEFPEDSLVGAALMTLARPDPGVSHATVTGVRAHGPISAYLPLAEFSQLALKPGDRVTFESDRRDASMLVRVAGSHLGPSRFAVPVTTRLLPMLDFIEVDPELSDIDAISLRRQSVAKRQKEAIEESLRRLETAVLGATSQTDEEAKIRVEEAKLITEFVRRAREVEPQGVLVVSRDAHLSNVLLQPDDVISIPERTNVVLVSGEVLVPQAIVFEAGASVRDYVDRVGGYTDRADHARVLVIHRNGEVVQGAHVEIRPGDEIIILPEVPVKNLQIAKTIVQVIFQLALSAAVALDL